MHMSRILKNKKVAANPGSIWKNYNFEADYHIESLNNIGCSASRKRKGDPHNFRYKHCKNPCSSELT